MGARGCCRRDEAPVIFWMRTQERERSRQARKAKRMYRTARNMLDSVRVRLTVWYSAVLAVVLVLVSATTYLLVRKTSMERTDADLAALSDSFLVTFQDELSDTPGTHASAVLSAARQSMVEHRSNSDAFVLLGPGGEVVATSSEAISSGESSYSSLTSALASSDFHRLAKTTS